MSNRDNTNPLQSTSLALQGFAFGAVLIFFSISTIDVFGVIVGFTFLPLAAVFLWPLQASRSLSLFLVFLLGLLYDLLSGGPAGIWMLSFLIFFIVIDGGIRQKFTALQAVSWFFVAVISVALLTLVLGRISIGQWPNLSSLGINIIASALVFPLVYMVRVFLGHFSNEVRTEKRL